MHKTFLGCVVKLFGTRSQRINEVSRVSQQICASNELQNIALNVRLIMFKEQAFYNILRAVDVLDFESIELHWSTSDGRELQAKVGH